MTVGTINPAKAWVADTEIYENYFLFAAKNVASGTVVSFEFAEGERFDGEGLRRFMRKHLVVTFNGNGFDLPIIYGAIAGFSTAKLKRMANAIILEKMKPWEVTREFDFSIPSGINHIDLMEVAPGKASLKIYNGRLHGKWMKDLPYDPEDRLTPRQMDRLYDYCINDLDSTIILFESLVPQLELRVTMSRDYGIDLRSKSDAQIAEAVIKKEIGDILGERPRRPEISPGKWYYYNIPEFIRFRSKELNDILDDIHESKFRVSYNGSIELPKALADAVIPIGKGRYRMGIGGLHSSETCAAHVSDDEYVLIDRDVASYYPAIILRLGLFPKHLGRVFLKVYKRIVDRRLKAKAEGDKTVADSLKITINGLFGKFGSKWAVVYSPDLLIQTTITGQLSLLMLIERIERVGIEVVSANTDGIVIKCPRARVDELDAIVEGWELDTSFVTEATEYRALYSRDVNNYIAIKDDGTPKLKGAYAEPGLMKNPQNEIAVDAVLAHITEGKSLYRAIRDCDDIRKFVTVRTVNGGAIWGVDEVEIERISEKTGKRLKSGVGYDTANAEYLGKAIRFYYSNEVEGCIHYKTNNNRVPKSEGARPLMTLPESLPDDIDYGWYVKEARSILKEIGFERELV